VSQNTKMTANQLYRKANTSMPFAKWIATMKQIHASQQQSVPFEQWLNMPTHYNTDDANGGKGSKIWETINKVGNQLADFSNSVETNNQIQAQQQQLQNQQTNTNTTLDVKKGTFMGLPKIVTIGIVVLLIGGVAYGIYKLVDKK